MFLPLLDPWVRLWLHRHAEPREDGASAVEYGLLLVGVAALIAAVVFLFGEAVLGLFTDSCDSLDQGSAGRLAASC